MANINNLKRVFVLGSTRISDPAPTEPLEVSTRLLAQTYPQFRWTEIYEEDGEVVGNTLEFKLVMPPPKVNG